MEIKRLTPALLVSSISLVSLSGAVCFNHPIIVITLFNGDFI